MTIVFKLTGKIECLYSRKSTKVLRSLSDYSCNETVDLCGPLQYTIPRASHSAWTEHLLIESTHEPFHLISSSLWCYETGRAAVVISVSQVKKFQDVATVAKIH